LEGEVEAHRVNRHQDSQPERVARSAGLVSLATLCSRITGLLREAVFAAIFATRGFADAYIFAFRIPNLLREFFAEGALSSAFVPTFTEARTKEGDERAFQIAARVMGTLAAVAGLVVLLGILFAPAIVSIVAMDAPPRFAPLTVRMTRIMFPFLLIVALAAVAMGILNSHRRYFLPALAPMFFNVTAVLGGAVLLFLGTDLETAAMVWAGLVVLGGMAQFLVQVPLLRRIGFRRRPEVDLRLRDPGLRQVVRRMGPVVLGLAATNVMIVITTILASQERGWASSLNYAFRLVHLPIGLVGVAVGTVVLAAGSRRHAAEDPAGLDRVLRQGLRLNWFLALPAAAGLFVLSEPLVRLIYERGHFGAESTATVAAALRYYAPGIVFYAGVKGAAPAFLTRGDTRTPMWCSLLGIAANLIVAFGLVGTLGIRALALAVAVGAATNYVALRTVARRRFGAASAPGVPFLLRCLVATAVLGLVGWALSRRLLTGDQAVAGGWANGLLTIGLVGALGLLYFLVATALGMEEGAWIRRRFWTRRQG